MRYQYFQGSFSKNSDSLSLWNYYATTSGGINIVFDFAWNMFKGSSRTQVNTVDKLKLLEGMDGTIRDLAGLWGSYRIVDKTVRAVELLLNRLDELNVKNALFYLDRQVSNSGCLRALLLDNAESHAVHVQVELHPGVDGVLSRMENIVTSDAIILDKCGSWYNLNRGLIERFISDAWIFCLNSLSAASK